MFCPKCGNEIANDAVFCMYCGNNIAASVVPSAPAPAPVMAQPVVDFQAQKNSIRQSELTSLVNAYEYFLAKKDEFDAYDMVCELVNHYAKGASKALLVWGIIITVLGSICSLAVLSEGELEALLGMLIILLLPGAAMIVGGILMQVKNRKNYAYYQEEYARLSQELYAYYMAYPNCPVGPEFSNPDILEAIISVIQSGRADTVKESINLLLNDAEMEEMNAYLASIEENTNAINAQTKVAAVFAAADFFLN